ncbi:4-hydroxy-tetrahydrodipicolinate reductase [Patescibacteria group bacterium]|nr:4-hydroxy-tetrahydrodipicolinate reductase [Patescibacteria group bacterium]
MGNKIKLAISGGAGRMGSAIWNLALADSDFEVAVVLERSGHPLVGSDANQIEKADVLIEFTAPEATIDHLNYALKYQKPMVIGTTGLNEAQIKLIKEASKKIPILFSPNMSIGINVLFSIISGLAKKLSSWDVEIIEVHRKAKKDAPSGTAKKFAQLISQVSGKEIPTHSLRVGDVAGDHTITFAGEGERIEISHRAQSPILFAKGALVLTKKLIKMPPGLYEPVNFL